MDNYIDIHSHGKTQKSTGAVSIYDPILMNQPPEGQYFVGVHPWNADKFNRGQFEQLLSGLADSPNCLGLGEVGLDRLSNVNFDQQRIVLLDQLEMARRFKLKRIVLHSVKAAEDVWSIVQTSSFLQILWHDYNQGLVFTEKVLKDQRCWFSYGRGLFRLKSKGLDSFKVIPLTRIFFETDDSNLCIEDVYQKASEILGLDLGFLGKQVRTNWELFKC